MCGFLAYGLFQALAALFLFNVMDAGTLVAVAPVAVYVQALFLKLGRSAPKWGSSKTRVGFPECE